MGKDSKLPDRLDTANARQLAAKLLDRRGRPAELDASAVAFGGALGLRVLAAACRQWREDDQPFRVVRPSDGLRNACRVLGIPLDAIGAGDPMITEENA